MCIFQTEEGRSPNIIGLNAQLPPTTKQISEYRRWEQKLDKLNIDQRKRNSSESEYETCSDGSR